MKVHNVNGTSANACRCGSRLEHWRRFSRQPLSNFCPEKSCTERPVVGALVQMDGPDDRGWYIIPLCETHNSQTGRTLEVSDGVALASASVGETCGR
jgi:hypothetical protein